jgi:hypothetical protein
MNERRSQCRYKDRKDANSSIEDTNSINVLKC